MTHETFVHDIEVQYRDLDPRSHVNHAHYVSYLEQAKAALFDRILGVSLTEPNTAIRHLEVDYEAPIEFDRSVAVALGPIETGNSSFTIQYELRDGEATVGTAETVSVLLDDDDRPRSVPDEWREALAPYAAGDG